MGWRNKYAISLIGVHIPRLFQAHCVRDLGLSKLHIKIQGTGETLLTTGKKYSEITINSCTNGVSCTVDALVLRSVSLYVPPTMVTHFKLPHLEELSLMDPQFMDPVHIDILLGASLYS